MGVKKFLRGILKLIRQWLADDDVSPQPAQEFTTLPFDNTYPWIQSAFAKILLDPVCAKRPMYIWGLLQGAALGKVLGYPRVSVVEFGVGGGAGLVALDHIAKQAEELINVGIDVYGFDTGTGMPKPTDYRDRPYFWLEGAYPFNEQELSKRLSRARLEIGLVKDTIQSFLSANPSPICFVGFDVCFYTSTKDALSLLDANQERLIHRIPCYFRSILGKVVSDFTGERLAISEFNAEHKHRKISPTYGLRWYVPRGQTMAVWPDSFLSLHAFDHPRYNEPQQLRMSTIIDVEGSEFFHAPRQWKGSL